MCVYRYSVDEIANGAKMERRLTRCIAWIRPYKTEEETKACLQREKLMRSKED